MSSPEPWACYHCGHAGAEHNLSVGCPHCRCSATPGEAGTDPKGKYEDQPLLRPGQYLHVWQDPKHEHQWVLEGRVDKKPRQICAHRCGATRVVEPPKPTFEPKVRYHVAQQREGQEPQVRDWEAFPEERHARAEAEGYNGDEAELSRLEQREVRVRFFVVKATTTYEEI